MDTSSIYVRGEENLGEWKPRGISLLDEHQSHLDKLERIQEVRTDRHVQRTQDHLNKTLKESALSN